MENKNRIGFEIVSDNDDISKSDLSVQPRVKPFLTKLSKKQIFWGVLIFLFIIILVSVIKKEKSQGSYRDPLSVETISNKELEFLKEENIKNAKIVKELLKLYVLKGPYTNNENKPLLIYAYHESVQARANILFFLRHGLHGRADFIFIVNGYSDIDKVIPTNTPNVKIIKRDNTCYDLGSIGEILRSNNYELVKKYKKFILMNSSVRGPFLPKWAANECWSDKFLNKVNEKVKLVGMSHNCIPVRHVQSMIIATDSIGINILLSGSQTSNYIRNVTAEEEVIRKLDLNPFSMIGLSSCYQNYSQAVSAEMSLTNLIYNATYEVDVLMTASVTEDYFKNCRNANPLIFRGYYGASLHPYETIFTKVNKEIYDQIVIDKLTDWHNEWEVNSWESCV